jgi:hypothetical protein
MRAGTGVSMLVVLPIDDVTHPVTAVLDAPMPQGQTDDLPAVAWMTVRLVTPCTISVVNRSFWLTPTTLTLGTSSRNPRQSQDH